MNLKTCHKCGQQKPASHVYFGLKTKTSKDGAKSTYLTSPCRDCASELKRAAYVANVEMNRQRIKAAVSTHRAKFGRGDRSSEYAKRAEARAIAAGWPSAAAKREAAERMSAIRLVAQAIKDEATRRKVEQRKTQPWQEPGLTYAERWHLRYRLDPLFKAQQILRMKARKAHIKQATPCWADTNELAAIYAARPEGFHVDHIVPLRGVTEDGRKVSGLHVPWNLRYLPGAENIGRSNRMTAAELEQVEACKIVSIYQGK